MTGIRKKQKENVIQLLQEIDKCETEEEIEKLDERAEIMVQLGQLTKKAYLFIEEAMDDRILTLVEEGKI